MFQVVASAFSSYGEGVGERVAGVYGVPAVELHRRRRLPHLSDARAAICYLAARHLGYKKVEVGRHLNLGRTGARAAVQRGQGVVQRNLKLLNVLGLQR